MKLNSINMKPILLFILIIISGDIFSQTTRDTTRIIVGDSMVVTVVTTVNTTASGTVSYNYPVKTTTITQYKVALGSTQPPNQIPTVNAGNDQTITLPLNSVNLNGVATDKDGTISSYLWTRVSGPTQFTIASPTTASTSVNGLVPGTYVFKLTVVDNDAASASDNISITVNQPNQPPDTTSTGAILGGGKDAIGGGNSTNVIHVRTASEFASARGSNRTIIFDANVTITGSAARWDVTNTSFLTVDGNGFDVTFDNGNNGVGISLNGSNTHHIILKGIRVINSGDDNIQFLDGSHDIAIVNCSSYDSRDGGLDITTGSYNVTVQYCFLGRGNSVWSGAMLIAYDNTRAISVHHNLIAPSTSGGVGERCPLTSHGSGVIADFRNNIVWKWGRSNGSGSGFAAGSSDAGKMNAVNNYFYATNSSAWSNATVNRADPNLPAGSMYAVGNFSGNSGVNANAGSNSSNPFTFVSMPTEDPCIAARKTISLAGVKNKNSYEQGVFTDAAKLPGCVAQ